jgi:hypothetical protein
MLTRTTATTLARRSSAMRRQRRRARAQLCNTNGCATALQLDPSTGVAHCPVCGYSRRLS